MRRAVLLLVVLALAAAGCGRDTAAGQERVALQDPAVDQAPATDSATTTPSTTTVPTPTAPSTTTVPTTTAPPTTTLPTTTAPSTTEPAATTTVPAFASAVAAVTEAELGASWRPGCPVGVDDLRALTLRHHTAAGGTADGVLVVHRDHVESITGVFAAIYAAGFPITSMRPVVEFGADDDRSMAADNTSAFNCREIAGRPGVWSEHSFGRAVDINPLVNPWVRGSAVDPPAGAAFADRSADAPGMIRPGDAVTEAFAAIGWVWGGTWGSAKDYQHFSSTGR